MKLHKKRIIITSIISVLLAVSLFIPTPYYIFQPGSVEELASKVEVEQANAAGDEGGQLHLTTVLSLRASNIYYLIYGLVAPHTELQRTQAVKGDMTDREYNRWLKYLMDSSQKQAIAAGLKAAGEDVRIRPQGMIIRSFSPASKAGDVLEAGDIIRRVDDVPVLDMESLLSYLENKQAGDLVSVMFKRDGQEKEEKVKLIPLTGAKTKVGLGVLLEEYVHVSSDKEVTIKAGEIGGPSAGLMFSMEIYRQLKDEDLAKGYQIAGTGTIDQDGNVGQIGGIQEKITAVEEADMDIFFCPKDLHPEDTNEKDVKETATQYDYKVKIIPVASLEEAVRYLEKLPPKL